MAEGLNEHALGRRGKSSSGWDTLLPLNLSVWGDRVWACAQVKGGEPAEDSLLGPIGDPPRHPLTFDPPVTFTLITPPRRHTPDKN